MAKSLVVVVTGATGKQGGAVARRLLGRGHRVRALTRKVDSAAAKGLAAAGAEIAAGSLEDRASLARALVGADAVFGMTTPFEAGGVATEVRQGIAIADAAKAAGTYLVFTSVASADKKTGIPHFDSKYEVEKHIAKIGVPAAVIAPVYFMGNAIAFGREQLRQGVYATALPPGRKLAQIALSDIAGFATLALENRDRFVARRYDLAGDDVSGEEAVGALSRVTGRKFSYFRVPIEAVRKMSEDMALMYEWFDRVGYQLDLRGLRRDFPEVGWHTFEAWAKEQNWSEILA